MKNIDNAVSPVIGVIVMIAITVILAAVVASFIFGYAGQVTHTKTVAASAYQPNDETIVVMYHGGLDASQCTSIKATVTTASGTTEPKYIQPASGPVPVGSVFTFQGQFSGKDRVVIIAGFKDGSAQTIYDSTL